MSPRGLIATALVIELDPDFAIGYWMLASADVYLDRLGEAQFARPQSGGLRPQRSVADRLSLQHYPDRRTTAGSIREAPNAGHAVAMAATMTSGAVTPRSVRDSPIPAASRRPGRPTSRRTRGRTLRGKTFAQFEALEHPTGLLLFVDEAWRPLQIASAKVREPGAHCRD